MSSRRPHSMQTLLLVVSASPETIQEFLRQGGKADLRKHFPEARLIVQAGERRVGAQSQQFPLTLQVRTLQVAQRVLFFPQQGAHLRQVVRSFLADGVQSLPLFQDGAQHAARSGTGEALLTGCDNGEKGFARGERGASLPGLRQVLPAIALHKINERQVIVWREKIRLSGFELL